VRAHGKEAVIVLLTIPDYVNAEFPPYTGYHASLKKAFPSLCIVDPFPELKRQSRTAGTLRAPRGHYNAGNQAIAAAIAAALGNNCR
jgi:hypothetical protein